MNQYRQGDVLLKPIQSIPEGAKEDYQFTAES